MKPFIRRMILAAGSVFAAILIAIPHFVRAGQIDIQGPPGSGLFGSRVAVLPNGNIVVADPWFSTTEANRVGAVHLYDPSGSLISTLTGSSDNDHVGQGRIVVLANGNFVVSTPDWNNAGANHAGAVTWMDADSGLSGVVSSGNSLVGTTTNDYVGGYRDVVALTNGHYVVVSSNWSNGGAVSAGAVTWGNGNGGTVGAISSTNSLIGTEANDRVGQNQDFFGNLAVLPNGNYVVTSWRWHQASLDNQGAVTWGNGEGGTIGPVSLENSLLETTDCSSDTGAISQITVLDNSNYLVTSPCWDNGTMTDVGAVTWADGSQPTSAVVSSANSLIGTHSSDRVGVLGTIVLANGNYVVRSWHWNAGRGAATWIDGSRTLIAGVVSPANSLVGSTVGDYASGLTTALANGHYVVGSWSWSSPNIPRVGAVTWADGTTGLAGSISAANSLTGSSENDVVGFAGVTALANGNYVVASPSWSNGPLNDVGAITLADGNGPTIGQISSNNSMIGSRTNDRVGGRGITALSNGAFVAASPEWSNAGIPKAGAVTWADGVSMLSGTVSPANSLVGTTANDSVGDGSIEVLGNGNYVIASSRWNDGNLVGAGATTWADGTHGLTGDVSRSNSLVGTYDRNFMGLQLTSLDDGNYAAGAANGQGSYSINSLTLSNGHHGTSGTVQAWNTLFADIGNATFGTEIAYDATRARLVVGRPNANVVTLFSIDDSIFAGGFE
ncbi:MAG TPA: hypothetical protein VFN25_00935 [Dokdonella sp.]|uniref:hypothetical protein n=1 Tax=Dokdonella sp. TaxID=2291710 RepID=UPI002D8081D9|nr:hypothetical protein [Dokdonella sp.]HET9031445.1 hypothetical protein [Dokdonella sp.]